MKKILKAINVFITMIFLLYIHFANSFENNSQKHEKLFEPFKINEDFMIKADEFYNWHRYKDEGGPTYSGSLSWRRYMSFIETKLIKHGAVDLTKNSWVYDRWYTSDWPDDSNWTLNSDGKSIKVAHYGAYSGSTGIKDMTAELIYYDPAAPLSSIEGKIVVFKTVPHPEPPLSESYKKLFTINDYECLTNPETFPSLFTKIPINQSVSADVWYQLLQTRRMKDILIEGKAQGGIIVFNMSYDRLAGLYTFFVPVLYHVPTLYVDRIAGTKLVNDARNGKIATLKLKSKLEQTETYQLIGYLPGEYYGTEKDEKILLITHTDGPSISQENGALGLLGIIAYFSNIPQVERPKTLMIFLDNRHYMPGMESAFANHDWFVMNPKAKDSIVALIAMEHLGQIEYKEEGDLFVSTGMVEPSCLWTRNNPLLIEKAIKAVKENNWPRVMVQCVEKTGIHGEPQGIWYGLGTPALDWNIPAFATMGTQGAYWSSKSRLDKFNKELFYTQVKTMTQLTGELMLIDSH
jgi:hypothetical protein